MKEHGQTAHTQQRHLRIVNQVDILLPCRTMFVIHLSLFSAFAAICALVYSGSASLRIVKPLFAIFPYSYILYKQEER